MDFIGEKVKRFVRILVNVAQCDVEEGGSYSFMKNKGLLTEYLDKGKEQCNATYLVDEDVFSEMTKIDGRYWYGPILAHPVCRNEKKGRISPFATQRIDFYRELPVIYNDDRLSWKRDGSGYATIIRNGLFEYHVKVKPDGNALIKVRYTKRDTYHKNNVTIAEINVYNASNDSILAAIDEWKGGFLAEVEAA